MDFYAFPPSPNDRKVRFVLKHLGIPFQDHIVDLASGAQKKPEYLKVNPFGRIPAIVDGDFRLSESHAIMQYLADKKPGSFFPADPRARIDVTRWQFWSTGQWGPACGAITFE
ncbi:MAG: glutathione S-transferase family protein, partial [Myxococcales bacterium]|nr:glutathione S-transferase family protein [Myxococcales bacterium]